MIEAKQAVHIAKQLAAEMLGPNKFSLEEIERESYKEREIWSITLSHPRLSDPPTTMLRLTADPLQYKRFLIDVETGDLVAMKLREFTTR